MSGTPGMQALMEQLASYPGVHGCALVDADNGMVWFHAGVLPDMERIGEASVEFWRMQGRLAPYFSALGPLQSVAYSFHGHMVTLLPCSARLPLVLVCVARKPGMDWQGWGLHVNELRAALGQSTRVALQP